MMLLHAAFRTGLLLCISVVASVLLNEIEASVGVANDGWIRLVTLPSFFLFGCWYSAKFVSPLFFERRNDDQRSRSEVRGDP